jgi:hypothetical protein
MMGVADGTVERDSMVRAAARALGVLAVSLLLLALAGAGLWYAGLHPAAVVPLRIAAADLALASGSGGHRDGALVLDPPPQGQPAIVVPRSPLTLDAGAYPYLVLGSRGLAPGADLRLVWRPAGAPAGQYHHREIPVTGLAAQPLYLGDHPHWQGELAELLLVLGGEVRAPVAIVALEWRPAAAVGPWAVLAADFTAFEGWTQRSVNMVTGGAREAQLPVIPLVALWMCLALLLLAVWRWRSGRPRDWRAVLLVCLAGWLVLDLRWQVNLWRQLEVTRAAYAGKTQAGKRLGEYGGGDYALAAAVRDRLPAAPQRILVLPSPRDQDRYSIGRVAYFLRPHNVYAWKGSPWCPGAVGRGGYLLALTDSADLEFDLAGGELRWRRCRAWRAESLLTTAAGRLFRLLGPVPKTSREVRS